MSKNWGSFNCGGSSSATAAKHSARVLRTGLYALLLAAGLPFAAQAQTCVPGATADWMATSDQLAAPIRPAECASVEQSPPDFGWPDISSDGVYQVTLTYPDGHAKTLAAAQNWINWDEVLPPGSYTDPEWEDPQSGFASHEHRLSSYQRRESSFPHFRTEGALDGLTLARDEKGGEVIRWGHRLPTSLATCRRW